MYNTLIYNSKNRWLSYWYQINETLTISPHNLLLVGKGSGITENSVKLLSREHVNVVTLDINPSLTPDVVGSVIDLPFVKELFDVSICCQVLEHLPFKHFSAAMQELHRVTKKRVVLSLPHGRKFLRFSFNISLLGEKDVIIKYPFTKKYCTKKHHYWEIGSAVSRKQVVNSIKEFFEIEKEFLNESNCYHRFFILKK